MCLKSELNEEFSFILRHHEQCVFEREKEGVIELFRCRKQLFFPGNVALLLLRDYIVSVTIASGIAVMH